jgi:hypothetical protein
MNCRFSAKQPGIDELHARAAIDNPPSPSTFVPDYQPIAATRVDGAKMNRSRKQQCAF